MALFRIFAMSRFQWFQYIKKEKMANINNSKMDRKPIFLDALKKSRGIVAPALNAAKIDRVTYLNWYHEDAEFKKAVDEINELQIDFVESKLIQNVNKGKETSVIFYLKTKGKNRGYIEKREVDVTSDGKPLDNNPLAGMPFDEVKRLYDAIQKKKAVPAKKVVKKSPKKPSPSPTKKKTRNGKK